jgi:hypothetical protein
MHDARTEREGLRAAYKPEAIRLLLIGESPPAGGTFFYRGNSILQRWTAAAMSRAHAVDVEDPTAFLREFRAAGYYLDDLCLEPVNHLIASERRRARVDGVQGLEARMASARPVAVACVMRGIAPIVRDALRRSGLAGRPFYSLPFPAQGHHRRYVDELASIMSALKSR